MGTTSGLSALAKMPACNVQLLGSKKKNLAGFSTTTSQFHVGFLEQAEVFQSTPPSLRMHACRLLAAKSTLVARVDSIRGDPMGKTGRLLLEEIRKKIKSGRSRPLQSNQNLFQSQNQIQKRKEVVVGCGRGKKDMQLLI